MAVQKRNKGFTRITLSFKEIIIDNFFGGLSWGLGTVIGATIVAAILIWILNRLGAVPFIGTVITGILKSINYPGN